MYNRSTVTNNRPSPFQGRIWWFWTKTQGRAAVAVSVTRSMLKYSPAIIFSNLWNLRVVSPWVLYSFLLPWEFAHAKIYQFDFNKGMDYWCQICVFKITSILFRCTYRVISFVQFSLARNVGTKTGQKKGGWNKSLHKRNDGRKHNRFLIQRESSYILLR